MTTSLTSPTSCSWTPTVNSNGTTWQVPYNDPEALESFLSKNKEIGAFILEPVLGNIGPVFPEKGYLEGVRDITRSHDVLLIFDEVITGYRLGIGGAQELYNVRPDLTTLGKIIGGGLPIGAFGGRREIMELIAPSGPVYQAGTFSGNPLSLAAGMATIQWLHAHRGIYRELDSAGKRIRDEITGNAGSFVQRGSMFKFFFRSEPPGNYREVKECDTARFSSFWSGMLKAAIFLPPSQFETNFLSAAHDEQDVERISAAYRSCL